MRRRALLADIGSGLVAGMPARAAATALGSRRLGVLLLNPPESWAPFRSELRKALSDLGWVEGQNVSTEWRYAYDDQARLPELASALARSDFDAILARGTPATRALQRATRTVPIVTSVGDAVRGGFARSLAHPGGNVTGLSQAVPETVLKQLDLLRAIVPNLSRLKVMALTSQRGHIQEMTHAVESAAQERGIAVQVILVGDLAELGKALQSGGGPAGIAAIIFGLGNTISGKDIASMALRNKLPTMFDYRGYVEEGGLMSYGLTWENQTQRTAVQLDKVFRGQSPSQIPFEQPTRSNFVINARTASALGLTIPPSLLARADEVIR